MPASAQSSVRITHIGNADLHRVAVLARRIWPEAFAGILPADRIPDMLDEIYAIDTLRADIALHGHVYWIALIDGHDAGYLSAYRQADRLWIKKIYLDAACRGRGIGKRLLDTAEAHFAPVGSIALSVNDKNAPAIGFYEAQGFAIEAHVPVRMGPFDFHDYIMARVL